MPVTLAQAKLAAQDDIQAGVIDEFRKSSFLLDAMTFDDVVTPGTSGASLVYGYQRLATQRTADTRELNNEYTPAEVTISRHTVDLKIFGGAFEIDRVAARVGGLADHITLQLEQLVKATRSKFHDLAINGDVAGDETEFDGLDVALTGSSTELIPDSAATAFADWTGIASQADAFAAMELLDELIALMDERPNAILGNNRSITRIKNIARWAGYLTQSEDAFGRKVDAYDGIPLVDLGDIPGGTTPIIPIETRDVADTPDAGNITGLTDIYAVRFGLDAFHGISLANAPLVETWLPDFSTAGAVKKGEAEMVTAVALKATKAAAVLRNVKVS